MGIPSKDLNRPLFLHAVRQRWDLHFEQAGYDPLFEHMKSLQGVRMSWSDYQFFARVALTYPHQCFRAGKHFALGHFDRLRGIFDEVTQRFSWMRSPPDVIHIGVADVLVGQIPKIRKLFPSTILVGTLHLPPDNWRSQPKSDWESLSYLDALIVLSSTQEEFFLQELPATKTIFVPHGVNTLFFRPPPQPVRSQAPRVVFAGIHKRNFGDLANVISGLISRHATVCFDLVIPAQSQTAALLQLGEMCSQRVVFHDNIPSSSLLDLYQQAHVAFLPLSDATANNTILEALACGLPVITTDVGGTRDYVTKDCSFLVSPADTGLYIEYLLKILNDEDTRLRMGKAARLRAQQFSWDTIAEIMVQVYSQLYSAPHYCGRRTFVE